MNAAERDLILAAVLHAARAAELTLTAEEDGDVFTAFVVDGALQHLAEQGASIEPVRVRAVLRALTGYGEAG